MSKPTEIYENTDPSFRAILAYHEDARMAKEKRMEQNLRNWDVYHLKQSWDHKKKGQSKEFLPKQANSVEQTTSFMQQGLMDNGEWFRVELAPGVRQEEVVITPGEAQKLIIRQLDKNNYPAFVSDSLKVGGLNSLMITKVGGCYYDMPKYTVEKEYERTANPVSWFKPKSVKLQKRTQKKWRSKLTIVRPEDWFPDPTGNGLFNQEVIEMDWHELKAMAEANPEEFEMATIDALGDNRDYLQESRKARESDQVQTNLGGRKRITFIEHWGTICDLATGKVLHENCVARYTKEGHCITKPMPNRLWHQTDPYIVCPIIRVPFSVWHKAMFDAATELNVAINEIFNLQLDAGIMSVFGIRQIREDWIENSAEISDGIAPATTLKVTRDCPPGQKVFERVDTGTLQEEAFGTFQLADREYQNSSFGSDIRMGQLPQRQTKATEVVASNQAINGTMNGVAKVIETTWVCPTIEKLWLTMMQHLDDFDTEEVKALLGPDRANKIYLMTPEERFAATALGFKYKVFGLSMTMNKIQDFKKYATLLQTIGTSEVLLKEFLRKYSLSKFMGEILRALDIDTEKLTPDQAELQQREAEAKQAQAVMMAAARNGQNGKRSLEQGADVQSQIPQIAAMPEETGMEPGNPANEGGYTGDGT